MGGPRLRVGDGWAAPPVNLPLLLLSYLVVREDWVARDELLAMFWSESSEAKARQNLRSLLYKCKQETWGQHLEVEEERIRCLLVSDVGKFQEEVASGNWQQAAQYYQGTFLERVKGEGSNAFEDWLTTTRDALHATWRDAVLNLASSSNANQLAQIIRLLQSVLAYDYLAEDVVQACMRAQAMAGQKAAALGTFETFRKQLGEELEVEPLETTLALAEAIRNDAFAGKKAQPTKPTTLILPQPQSPFIGRTLELLELSNLLTEPHNRLITLLGPGGMGKTRLALQLLKEQAQHFEDGVAFVGLASLSSDRDIPDAVASGLGLKLSGGTSVAEEVFEYLKAKHMLIALDNFDHLLQGVPLVGLLLEAAPSCKFVCTSRALLGAPGEVVYDVFGLTVPTSSLETNLEAYDAAQLFLRSARRIRSDFTLDKSDYPALFELCKTLDGMPLALELAATWVRLFSLKELLGEIRRDMDLLEATGQQVSERHQSLRKVFEYSWQLLNTEEQRALAALSVFHDGFTRQAAQTVAQVSAKTLLALVNKSFVRAGPSGRFGMLEVLRQYAAERLGEGNYQEQHGVYYLNFLTEVLPELSGSSPKGILTQLEQDLENIRSAWQWALGARRFDLCVQAVEPLRVFLMAKARVQEGIAFFEQALRHLDHQPEPGLLTSIHIELAYFYRRLDEYKKSTHHAEQALTLARSIPDDSLTTKALYERAFIRTRVGQFVESAHDAEQALELAKGLEDLDLEVRISSLLALAKRYLGQFAEAEQLYRFVLAQERQMGQQISVMRTLSDLGRLLVDLERPLEARALFSEGLELAQAYNIPYELGFMWEGLSQCSYLLGDYPLAQQQAQTAIQCSEEVGDTIGVAVQSIYLGKIHLALENLGAAQAHLRQALKIAWDHSEMPEIMKVLVVWANLLIHQQAPARAAELLGMVLDHPGAEARSKQEAQHLLDSLNPTTADHQIPLDGLIAGLLE